MTTITLYLYDERGVYTETIEHPIKAPLPSRWTKVAPPETQDGEWVVWDGKQWMIATEEPPFPESVAPVPQSVSRFQARAALHLAGLLESVETLMQDPETDMIARLAWQDAQEFERQSPTVLAMTQTLGLTDAQIDELFITAAGIEA